MSKRNLLYALIGITLCFGCDIFGMIKGLQKDELYKVNCFQVAITDENSFPNHEYYEGILKIEGDKYSIRARHPKKNTTICETHWQHMPITQAHLTAMKSKQNAFYLYATQKYHDDETTDEKVYPMCGIKIVRIKQVVGDMKFSNKLEDYTQKSKVKALSQTSQKPFYRNYAILAMGAGIIFLLHRFTNIFSYFYENKA